MPKRRQMKNGKLSDVARHVVLPSGITSTAWPSVRDKCADLGVRFDDWQDGAGRAILAKREDGEYACSIGGVVISIPRQVGKTFLIGAIVFALCLLRPGITVIWTAHRARTAGETFQSMQAFANRRKVKPFVKNIVLGSGDEAIEFHNKSRVLFGARERGFGRGFSEVHVVVFDEAQILTENAIDDMVPATNAAENALVVFTGTPPKPTDPSEVFSRKRTEAIDGEDEDTLYIEFSADEDCNPKDRKQWAKANPSYPTRTNDAAMLRMLKMLTLESFVREALGIWDSEVDEVDPNSIDLATWDELAMPNAEYLPETARLAVDVAYDRSWATVALAGETENGLTLVKLVAGKPGTQWIADRVGELVAELDNGQPVWIPKGEAIADDLAGLDVEVEQVTPGDMAIAARKLIDSTKAESPTVCHLREKQLRVAIKIASTKPYSDNGITWSRKASAGDISPLTAATLAFGAEVREPAGFFAY